MELALCQCLLTALDTPPAIIRERVFIIVHDLWPPALKQDPAFKRHGGYSRQYGTHMHVCMCCVCVCVFVQGRSHQFWSGPVLRRAQ